jgi:hypothetical protein
MMICDNAGPSGQPSRSLAYCFVFILATLGVSPTRLRRTAGRDTLPPSFRRKY